MITQPDLFGEDDAAEHARLADRDARTAWEKTLLGPIVPMPWKSSSGIEKGTPVQTWRCPVCGRLELGEYMLHINHGVIWIPNEGPDDPWCAWLGPGGGFELEDGQLVEYVGTTRWQPQQ